MKILAIETATDACSAALSIEGEVQEDFRLAPREHAALLLPMVDSLLAAAGLSMTRLDAVAFGRGPGSFTGLRIAAGMAQGLAFGAGLPVVPVSTLAALAQGTLREHGAQQVLVALDARMQEVYWAVYQARGELVVLQGDETVCAPAAVPLPAGGDWTGAGSGWSSYEAELMSVAAAVTVRAVPEQRPHARDIAALAAPHVASGDTLAPEQALPVYLRDKVASKPA